MNPLACHLARHLAAMQRATVRTGQTMLSAGLNALTDDNPVDAVTSVLPALVVALLDYQAAQKASSISSVLLCCCWPCCRLLKATAASGVF